MITIGLTVQNLDRMKTLGGIRPAILPTMVKTANRGLWIHVVRVVKDRIPTESGIGRTIWGTDPSGLTKQRLVRTGRLLGAASSATTGQASLVQRGIPALLEKGGQIKPHMIRNAFGHRGRTIPHPGMTLRPHHIGEAALSAAEGQIRADIDEALTEMLRRHGL